MILFAEEREKSWTQHPRLRSFLRGCPFPTCIFAMACSSSHCWNGTASAHGGRQRGERNTLKCQRRFQAVFPNTRGICFLLVVSEKIFKSTCASHLRRQNRKSHGLLQPVLLVWGTQNPSRRVKNNACITKEPPELVPVPT